MARDDGFGLKDGGAVLHVALEAHHGLRHVLQNLEQELIHGALNSKARL